jgi:hypothetical protein
MLLATLGGVLGVTFASDLAHPCFRSPIFAQQGHWETVQGARKRYSVFILYFFLWDKGFYTDSGRDKSKRFFVSCFPVSALTT